MKKFACRTHQRRFRPYARKYCHALARGTGIISQVCDAADPGRHYHQVGRRPRGNRAGELSMHVFLLCFNRLVRRDILRVVPPRLAARTRDAGTDGDVWTVIAWDRTAPDPTTCLVAGGLFHLAGTAPANNIAMWNPQTGVWSALGAGVNNQVNALRRAGDRRARCRRGSQKPAGPRRATSQSGTARRGIPSGRAWTTPCVDCTPCPWRPDRWRFIHARRWQCRRTHRIDGTAQHGPRSATASAAMSSR